jgi:hypothetical protein
MNDPDSSNSISKEEEKKKENKCRICGEKWARGHRCAPSHTYHYKNIDGKEVQVSTEEDLLDTDEDENSPKVSLASTSCIKQTHKGDKSDVLVQEDKPPIGRYTPPHMRRKGITHNSQGGKPMILFEASTKTMKPNTLRLKGNLKGKNITIIVDLRSTHNFVGINLAKQLNLFVYPVKDLMVTTAHGQPIKGVGRCHKVSIHIQNLELQTGFKLYPFMEWT